MSKKKKQKELPVFTISGECEVHSISIIKDSVNPDFIIIQEPKKNKYVL